MLYKTKEIWMIVPDEAGENEAKKDGWLNSWTDKVEAKEERLVIDNGTLGVGVHAPNKALDISKVEIKEELSPQQRAAITRKKNKEAKLNGNSK